MNKNQATMINSAARELRDMLNASSCVEEFEFMLLAKFDTPPHYYEWSRDGICSLLDELDCRISDGALFEIFEAWPLYSGNLGFPVPAEVGSCDMTDYHWSSASEKWFEGEYAANRRNLLDFIIDYTEEKKNV